MIIYLQMIESQADKEKFERLYTRYRGLMLHVALRILHDQQDAEDAVHQAFLSILKNLKKISEVNCPETRSYIVIIVERKSIDLLRAGQRIVPFTEDAGAGLEVPPPDDHGLADAMARLPARYREILLLRFDNGYTTRELAKLLGMSQSSVQKLIWRAKQALRETMKEGDGQ